MTIEQKKPVGKFLLTHEVDNLISNYKQQRWAANSEKIGRADTLNIWWTIDELENFLAVAKENQADGVKFCFGVYDAENKKAGQQTIAMVATQEVETENGTAHKNVYKQTPYGKNIVAYNGGKSWPPKEDNGITFDPYELGITIVETADKKMIVV
jgi:hypothetical protein